MADLINRTHQFWSAARHVVDVSMLSKIYKVSHRQIHRWGADPDYCDQCQKNPLDRIVIVCRRLQELGRDDIVEGGLRRLLEPLGYSFSCKTIKSDKGSIALELLDVSRTKGDLINAYQEANADYKITADEQAELLSRADEVIFEVEQLKDAIRHGKEVGGA